MFISSPPSLSLCELMIEHIDDTYSGECHRERRVSNVEERASVEVDCKEERREDTNTAQKDWGEEGREGGEGEGEDIGRV